MTGGKQLPSEPAVIAAVSKAGNDFFKAPQSKADTWLHAFCLPTSARQPEGLSTGVLETPGGQEYAEESRLGAQAHCASQSLSFLICKLGSRVMTRVPVAWSTGDQEDS